MNKIKEVFKWALNSGILECIIAVIILMGLSKLFKMDSNNLLIALIIVNVYQIKAELKQIKNRQRKDK